MIFEWDEFKRFTNLTKHDIDFLDARRIFDGRPVNSTPSPYPSEERYLSTGIIEDRLITVIWTQRGDAVRIISARRARDGEKRAYRALHG